MTPIRRTIRQWWATCRRLEHREIGRLDLAQRIRWALPTDPNVPPDTFVTVRFLAADAVLIERRASGWRVHPSDWGRPTPPTVGRAEEAIAAAEAIIQGHQRRRNT
ncbi:MAG: hypothetical protein M3R02_21305 [Chloroflexota bacterium]|nr:hypothetical protein [Chloroflexota bacterium]